MKHQINSIGLILAFTLRLPIHAHAQEGGPIPEKAATPFAHLEALVQRAKSSSLSAAISEHKREILDWQTKFEKKKTDKPLVIRIFPGSLKKAMQATELRRALGEPDRTTKGKMAGLVDIHGNPYPLQEYWYGDIGFGFIEGEGPNFGLCMIELTPKR